MPVTIDGLPITGGTACPETEIISASEVTISLTLGEDVQALRVMRADISGLIWLADTTDVTQFSSIVGISSEANTEGMSIKVVTAGQLDCPGHIWEMDKPIFFDQDGVLTQTPPVTGFVMIIGYPTGASSMNVRIEQPVILA